MWSKAGTVHGIDHEALAVRLAMWSLLTAPTYRARATATAAMPLCCVEVPYISGAPSESVETIWVVRVKPSQATR